MMYITAESVSLNSHYDNGGPVNRTVTAAVEEDDGGGVPTKFTVRVEEESPDGTPLLDVTTVILASEVEALFRGLKFLSGAR